MTNQMWRDAYLMNEGRLLTDERPCPVEPDSLDDPRPAEILADAGGVVRRRGHWRRVLTPISDLCERLLLAARSVS